MHKPPALKRPGHSHAHVSAVVAADCQCSSLMCFHGLHDGGHGEHGFHHARTRFKIKLLGHDTHKFASAALLSTLLCCAQPLLPKLTSRRLSTTTRHRPLHSSTTLRSEAATRLTLRAEVPPDECLAIPSLGLSAAAVVRPGHGRRHKASPASQLQAHEPHASIASPALGCNAAAGALLSLHPHSWCCCKSPALKSQTCSLTNKLHRTAPP